MAFHQSPCVNFFSINRICPWFTRSFLCSIRKTSFLQLFNTSRRYEHSKQNNKIAHLDVPLILQGPWADAALRKEKNAATTNAKVTATATHAAGAPSSQKNTYTQNVQTSQLNSQQQEQTEQMTMLWPVDSRLIKALAAMGIERPTPIQSSAIARLITGQSAMLKAMTGEGKTLAFLLPCLQRILNNIDSMKKNRTARNHVALEAIIIVPTRELAWQVHDVAFRILRHALHGGTLDSISISLDQLVQMAISDGEDEQTLERITATPPAMLIGTPKRLMKLFFNDPPKDVLYAKIENPVVFCTPTTTGRAILHQVKLIVLDEVDQLIRPLGRHSRQQSILNRRHHPKPALLFLDSIRVLVTNPLQLVVSSATASGAIKLELAKHGWLGSQKPVLITGNPLLTDGQPLSIPRTIQHSVCIAPTYDQVLQNDLGNIYSLKPPQYIPGSSTLERNFELFDISDKYRAVAMLLHDLEPRASLMVVDNNVKIASVTAILDTFGVEHRWLHEQLNANAEKRDDFLQRYVRGERIPWLLVTTIDTLRGLDLPNLSHVFVAAYLKDFDDKAYVHAAGRTGRAGASGHVILLVSIPELRLLQNMLNFLKLNPNQIVLQKLPAPT